MRRFEGHVPEFADLLLDGLRGRHVAIGGKRQSVKMGFCFGLLCDQIEHFNTLRIKRSNFYDAMCVHSVPAAAWCDVDASSSFAQ